MALLRRLGWSLVILVGVTFLTFVIAFVVPSDPARTVAGPKADPETLATIRRELGLDQPVPVQYVRYLSRLARGDLGRSYLTRQPVSQAILERLPATAYLALTSLAAAALIGIVLGCLTALRQGTAADMAVLVGSLVLLSLPVFWLGMMLLYFVAYRARLLPLGGFGAVNVILPACTLALGNAAYYTRLLHTNMRTVLHDDYIRTARAKGLSPFRVYGKHALRNALIPLVTVLGLDFAGLMSGVVLTETVFNWPGLGRLAVEAVFNQDIPLIMGTVLFSAVLVVAANIVVDCVYLAIDPRMRYPRQ
ncbi:MAG: glutathione transporter permease [Deltaproteobacteria bacterium]|nr:glutathione transporter permease [Deltaproteobacteria bacterium]